MSKNDIYDSLSAKYFAEKKGIENYGEDYLEIRAIVATIIGFEDLFEIEESLAARNMIVTSYRSRDLDKIVDIIKSSSLYASEKDKGNALIFESRNHMKGYFYPEYLKIREEVCRQMELRNLLVLEPFKEFQELCLKIDKDKYYRLSRLILVVKKFGLVESMPLYIPEIFNVKDENLTDQLIEIALFGINDTVLEKIKTISEFKDKKGISSIVVDYVFDTLGYDVKQSRILLERHVKKLENMKDYKFIGFVGKVPFEAFELFVANTENGTTIGKFLKLAVTETPKYLEMISNESKSKWFAVYINKNSSFVNRIEPD